MEMSTDPKVAELWDSNADSAYLYLYLTLKFSAGKVVEVSFCLWQVRWLRTRTKKVRRSRRSDQPSTSWLVLWCIVARPAVDTITLTSSTGMITYHCKADYQYAPDEGAVVYVPDEFYPWLHIRHSGCKRVLTISICYGSFIKYCLLFWPSSLICLSVYLPILHKTSQLSIVVHST